ncbi:PAS domain-containing sensor histidine kinase [Leptospira langatensis]|uniref:histidine kinase n=1 Tax=Leptospira langatensis TaxID=2484983 RepID=A0A5F1ZUU0_9LEPT|nr:PAS domain-containing sensor histidine kinase [Leptospira langatensis]TGJ98740.1 PAS domain-containing sensor histidine kinase [Leptospira langatensis]TGL40693.1 PAS domain-containing sensor histidine kinase [Leptospira langatensis]
MSLKKWRNIILLLPATVGILVLLGWTFDIEPLKRPRPTWVAMNPMSGLCFILSSLALFVFSDLKKEKREQVILLRVFAFSLIAVGFSRLLSVFGALDLGVDQILFSDKLAKDIVSGVPNRMAPNTAFDFYLLGFSFLFATLENRYLKSIANYLALIVMLIGLFSVMGYLYQVKEFYGVLSFIPMAIHTAICFIVTALVFLFQNGNYGFMQVFTSGYSGGRIARFLAPFVILVPVIFGFVRIYLQHLHPVSVELGVGILMTGIILSFFTLVWFISAELNRTDLARTEAENELSRLNHDLEKMVQTRTMDLYKSENRFRTIIEQFPYPVLTYTPEGVCTGANLAWEDMWETRRDNLVDYNILNDPQMRSSGLIRWVEKAFQGEPSISEPFIYDPKDIGKGGRPRWLQLIFHPIKNTAGVLLEVITVQQDITSNKEAENQIRSLNNDLEERVKKRTEQLELANKELESFSYSISHDLRAPIRGISGFTQILLEDYGPQLDAEAMRIIGKIIENAKQMGQLVDDLLEFSRLGRTELTEREVQMKDLALFVFNELKGAEFDREIKFEISNLPMIKGDQSVIRQLWINLISNAIKYTRKKEVAYIEIGFKQADEEVVFFVKDNGAGFNMQYYHKLFGVFQRLHSNSDFEGTGVGLAIVKRIVSRHGGRIWAESKEGEGTTFYFTLPGHSE